MGCLHAAVHFLNMIYVLCYYLVAVVRLAMAALWCTFALIGAGIPWLLAAATALWCIGQVAQLQRPRATVAMSAALRRLLRTDCDVGGSGGGGGSSQTNGGGETAVRRSLPALYWPVASRGAALDAPANSMAALRMVGEGNWVYSGDLC